MYRRILVPIDGSSTADFGLAEAIRLASLSHATIRLIHVVEELPFALGIEAYGYSPVELRHLLRKHGAEILTKATARVRAHCIPVDSVLYEAGDQALEGRVAAEVDAWNADLIVLGTHGRRGVSRILLGSRAEEILRSAAVLMLFVLEPQVDA